MKLQFTSDLHLEFYNEKPRGPDFFAELVEPTDADILVLAGDIGYPELDITRKFMHWACTQWRHVIWVLGNHEYYNKHPATVWRKKGKIMSMTEKEVEAENYMINLPNLSVLLDSVVEFPEFPGYAFIGSTLWTDIRPDQHISLEVAMSDFTYIQDDTRHTFNPTLWSQLHAGHAGFIARTLDAAASDGKKAIVVTHHLPTYRMILPQYRDSPMNHGFAANCDGLLKHPAVAGWFCGHSHGQLDLPIERADGSRIFCRMNARGYPREESVVSYHPAKCAVFG